MITEQQWATFAKHVRPGTLIKFSLWDDGDGSEWVYGYLADSAPHSDRFVDASWPCLAYTAMTYRSADDEIKLSTFPADYMRFWVWDGWYSFDDIYDATDIEDDPPPFAHPSHDGAWTDDAEACK